MMSNENSNTGLSEQDEIEALLPWYVAGKLDPHLRAQVERYVEMHPEISGHLALAREESDATITANEAILPPGRRAVEGLRASVAAMPRRQSLSRVLGPILDRCMDWIGNLAPPQLAMVATVTALVVIVQAAAIGALVLERARTPAYQTAAGSDQGAGEGIEMLVGFSDKATIGEITALLKKLDAVVTDGPRSGLYRVRLPASEAGDHGREAAIGALRQSGIVTMVLPGR